MAAVRGVAVGAVQLRQLDRKVELLIEILFKVVFAEIVEGARFDQEELVRDGAAREAEEVSGALDLLLGGFLSPPIEQLKVRGPEDYEGSAATRDIEALAERCALHEEAETVSELVCSNAFGIIGGGEVELVGLEPTTSAMPWRRSSS